MARGRYEKGQAPRSISSPLEEALAGYREAINRAPNDIVARNGLASVLLEMGRVDEALAAYEEINRRFPADVVGYMGRAETLRAKGQLNDAVAAYQSIVEQFPNQVVAYNGLAQTFIELGQPDEALRQFEATIIRFPADNVARNGRAELLRQLGRLDVAKPPPSAEAIPGPERRAVQFGGRIDGPIDLAAVSSPGDHLEIDSGRREDYIEIREKAAVLNSFGTNRLANLHAPVSRFLKLPEDIAQVRARIFWSRTNSLRIALEGHEQARTTSSEPDERKLEASVAGALKDLVETINVFVVGDPSLMDLDAARPGPQEIAEARDEVQTLAPMLNEAVTNEEIATEQAREVLGEQVNNAHNPAESLHERQASDFSQKTIRNFVGELLRRAYAPVRALAKSETAFAWKGVREGAYRAVGAGLLTGAVTELTGVTNFHESLMRFVARHAETLAIYVMKAFQNPTLIEIINWIARLAS
ncbi:MAG TPA: tetratricopeptide repeat protein [Bradyrhizobium sp.]|uniref:tetratricopeptide repeat protein n=1 Tax=Bradyrhizobium sp. TaxID=376 RepID=UPI002CC3724D|nr:tetratricopeptide repeat protein [Bradyrhizobium sp.]HTB04071.1 tetratricopeptide repeat protein [Bradyrhizobium sp.]